VPDRRVLEYNIEWLRGRRGIPYRDLKRIVRECGCTEVAGKSSHHVWAYPGLGFHLNIPDRGSHDVLFVYIKKTREYLEAILATL
jgi:hypothetical protein